MEQANLLPAEKTRDLTAAAGLSAVWLSGCDPVVSVAGADFPDWLVCVIGACLLCAASHLLFRRAGLERHLKPLPFFYGALILMFSLIIWVSFFNRA